MSNYEEKNRKGFLSFIEKVGNGLPDISVLFLIAIFIVMILSWFLSNITFNYFNPITMERIEIKSLLSIKAILDFIVSWPSNYAHFPPFAAVILVTIGIALMEGSGMLQVVLKQVLKVTPVKLLTPIIVAISILCHLTADASYMFLMPVTAMSFYLSGRHPLAGVAASFAGLAGAFSAGFTPSIVDPIMQGFTQEAAQLIDPNYTVNVLANYYYSFASAFMVILVCWYITDVHIEPRLNKLVPIDISQEEKKKIENITINDKEKKALFYSIGTFVMMGLLLFIFCLPDSSLLRAPNGSLTSKDAPIMKMIIPLIFLMTALPGLIHGIMVGIFSDSKKTIKIVGQSVSSVSGFLVFVFFAAQFLYVFKHSGIATLMAISGGEFLKSINALPSITIIGIILLTGLLNLIVTSATSKWSILAPIMVPMLMSVNIAPELTQAAFRISDSAINVVTPMFIFYPLIISYVKRYCSTVGIGTLSSVMLPYSLGLMVVLTVMLFVFWWIGIPLGIDSSYVYPK